MGKRKFDMSNLSNLATLASGLSSAYVAMNKKQKPIVLKPPKYTKVKKMAVKGTQAKSNTKVSHSRGYLAGKYRRKGKKVKGRTRYLKKQLKLSKFKMSQKGITYREEFRKQDGIAANESRVIGHTSIPVRATYYNIMRSLIKTLFGKAAFHIDAFTSNTGLSSVNVFDISVRYSSSWETVAVSTQTWTPAGAIASGTWGTLCDTFADWFRSQFIEDPREMRWEEIELRPPGAASNLAPQRVRMSLAQTYFLIKSKSALKFQNQSGLYPNEGTILQTDDVNSVPIECSMYYIKGNKFINQNRKISPPVGLGNLGFDLTLQTNDIGSEPMPAYEILNCSGRDKIYMDPGHIKTSIISYSGYLNFGAVIRLLLIRDLAALPTVGGWTFSDETYMRNLGHSRAIHCDRVIGANSGSVRLMIELELTQQIACLGKLDTSTDQYEVHRS